MKPDGVEKKILEKMSVSLVAQKRELIELIKGKSSNPKAVVEAVTKSLVSRGLLTPIYASESTFAITQKGIKEASV